MTMSFGGNSFFCRIEDWFQDVGKSVVSCFHLHREKREIQNSLSHVQNCMVPLKEHYSDDWSFQMLHYYEDFMKFDVTNLKFKLNCAFKSLQLSICDHDLKIRRRTFPDNRL